MERSTAVEQRDTAEAPQLYWRHLVPLLNIINPYVFIVSEIAAKLPIEVRDLGKRRRRRGSVERFRRCSNTRVAAVQSVQERPIGKA